MILNRTSMYTWLYDVYRTRANNGRSRLVDTPLSSQAKMHFWIAFYVTFWETKQDFLLWAMSIIGVGTVYF